ncbi:MAG: hypothetical protein M1819_005725 [Sarea resinae]|nr:MAG: hypothetical protein M1819_005725 [Sarea resinae]
MNSRQRRANKRAARITTTGSPSTYDSYDDAASIFVSSMETFRDSLSADDQQQFREFDSPQAMMDDILNNCRRMKDHSKLMASCKLIRKFANGWSPFFSIIDIFVSSNPQWAGLAWGAIRLVFLLSSNYPNFFEKLAEMFEKIFLRLPSYEDQIRRLRGSASSTSQPRLIRALSYVYADIIQFCRDACKIFTNKRGDVIRQIFWKPFDNRFSDLLDRLRDHQELFDIEIKLEDQQALTRFIDKMEAHTQRADKFHEERRLEMDQRERDALRARVIEIKNWVSAPDFMGDFERARRNRLADTGQWLIEDDRYQSWRAIGSASTPGPSTPLVGSASFAPRVLSMLGFGKTTLSTLLIEDLEVTSRQRNIAFFHFDAKQPQKSDMYHALRAILIQLVHRNQLEKDVVDTVSILMDVTSRGQPHASDDEVQDIVRLYLQKIPNVVLVFDGIDECSELTMFLRALHTMTQETQCRILFLGRPNISFPMQYSQHCRLELDPSANLGDIRLYLRLEVDELMQPGLLAGQISAEELVERLALRAGSMFLWAKLMVQYLHSPALSPRQRLQDLENLYLLEGLDSMYDRTMQVLEARYAREKELVSKIFSFLAVALRPLGVSELQAALALYPGQSIDPSNYISNFEDSIIVLCGGLVEVRPDKTVRFIHLSVNDFLTSNAAVQKQNYFQIEIALAHLSLAKVCLSYLTYDMPASPLGGSAENSAEKAHLESWLPLLSYAAQSWSSHIARGMQITSEKALSVGIDFCCDLTQSIEAFIKKPYNVTAWVEACWVFEKPPNIAPDFEIQLKDLEHAVHSSDDRLALFLWTCRKLLHLSNDLDKLDKDWGHLLEVSPHEIWGPSVTAMLKSDFLVITTATEIISLVSQEDPHDESRDELRKNSILIASKNSSDGSNLGVVTVWPSEEYVDALETIDHDEEWKNEASYSEVTAIASPGWTAKYEVFILGKEKKKFFELEVSLPQEEVSHILEQSFRSQDRKSFRFPVAFSHDLRQVVLLHTVATIFEKPKPKLGAPKFAYSTQTIGLFGNGASELDEEDYPSWYKLSFSPNGKHLAVVKRIGRAEVVQSRPHGRWSVAIWEDHAPSLTVSKYRYVSEMKFNTTNFLEDGSFAFHRTLSFMAVSGDIATLLWAYTKKPTDPRCKRRLFNYPLHNLHFSADGRYLYGTVGYPVMIDLQPFLDNESYTLDIFGDIEPDVEMSDPGPAPSPPQLQPGTDLVLPTSSTVLTCLDQNPLQRPATQDTNAITISHDQDGRPIVSVVRHYEEEGVVVQRTLADGIETTSTLIHLPRWSDIEHSSITLLHGGRSESDDEEGEAEVLQMVLNKDPQDFYTLRTGSGSGSSSEAVQNFPIIIERRRASIAVYKPPPRRRKGQILADPAQSQCDLLRLGNRLALTAPENTDAAPSSAAAPDLW